MGIKNLGLVGLIGGMVFGVGSLFSQETLPSDNPPGLGIEKRVEDSSKNFNFQETNGERVYSIHPGTYQVVEESSDGKNGVFLGYFIPSTDFVLSQFKDPSLLVVKTAIEFDHVNTPEKTPDAKSVKLTDNGSDPFKIVEGKRIYSISPGTYQLVEERGNVFSVFGYREIKKTLRFSEVDSKKLDYSSTSRNELYFRKPRYPDLDNGSLDSKSYSEVNLGPGKVEYQVTLRDKNGDVVERHIGPNKK